MDQDISYIHNTKIGGLSLSDSYHRGDLQTSIMYLGGYKVKDWEEDKDQ